MRGPCSEFGGDYRPSDGGSSLGARCLVGRSRCKGGRSIWRRAAHSKPSRTCKVNLTKAAHCWRIMWDGVRACVCVCVARLDDDDDDSWILIVRTTDSDNCHWCVQPMYKTFAWFRRIQRKCNGNAEQKKGLRRLHCTLGLGPFQMSEINYFTRPTSTRR